MLILKGSEAAKRVKDQVGDILKGLRGYIPRAAIVRVGERPDDLSYEKNVMKKIAAFGMEARSFVFSEDIAEDAFLEAFKKINEDPEIDGILLFQPLPGHIDGKKLEEMIDPGKDLDGISPVNAARVFAGEKNGFAPCTAEAVMEILHTYDIPIEGKRAVIVGRSMVVGRPLSMLLLSENATVTVCHSRTADLVEVCRTGDILVAAIGKASMITAEHAAKGAAVIDVGINVDEEGRLCGDVKWEGLEEKAGAATPVPGGVGAVTTAVLCKHLAMAAERTVLS